MKIYKTLQGVLIEYEGKFFLTNEAWNVFINNDHLYKDTLGKIRDLKPINYAEELITKELLPPIGAQEIWAAGVTYMRSKTARMDESKNAGGGDFYDRVYSAERPELFFKSTSHRTAGSGENIRIRKDSKWNVPEPELTLMISSRSKIIGYTIGNDMSSRDIEGQNPLYLPQAKTYDKSAAIGPCVYVTEEPLPSHTEIKMKIVRKKKEVFSGMVTIDQMKRKFTELVEYLYRETSFPSGCLLMTGTGIIPPDDFTLQQEDEVRITVEPIGTLVNFIE